VGGAKHCEKGAQIIICGSSTIEIEPLVFPLTQNTIQIWALQDALEDLLLKSAVESIPEPRGCILLVISGSKERVGWRIVTDLGALNKHLIFPHFRMETFQSIIHAVQLNKWVCSIDLQNAYFQVAMHPCFKKYLFHSVWQSISVSSNAIYRTAKYSQFHSTLSGYSDAHVL